MSKKFGKSRTQIYRLPNERLLVSEHSSLLSLNLNNSDFLQTQTIVIYLNSSPSRFPTSSAPSPRILRSCLVKRALSASAFYMRSDQIKKSASNLNAKKNERCSTRLPINIKPPNVFCAHKIPTWLHIPAFSSQWTFSGAAPDKYHSTTKKSPFFQRHTADIYIQTNCHEEKILCVQRICQRGLMTVI